MAALPSRCRLLPLQVRDLGFTVRGMDLLDTIQLDLETPGISVIMGPNGAGKSLLLRLLHGLLTPSRGSIHWGGVPLDDGVRKRQALVFQRPMLLRRSVLANIRFVLKLRGDDNRERAREILRHVDLERLAEQPARRLSGGEQQRLAMARALALRPEVLFMDEATASLDPASVAAIEALVREARDKGVKVILVTHDLGQAHRLADDVVFLHRGRLTEYSSAQAFFDRPGSAQARDYVAGRLVL